MKSHKIPGYERLKAEVQNCIDSNQSNQKDLARLNEMKALLNMPTVKCLRVSDFNTTGVTGVTEGRDNNWYYLTKGSGQSFKTNNQGGSKGIGKYSSFVASKLQLVFYSTVAKHENECEKGYEGICKLCSASMEDTDERTTGEGVFGRNFKNEAVLDSLDLDDSFKRDDDQYGADVYIVAFRDDIHWKKRMITRILDSFMVAIHRGVLECDIDGTKITSATLGDVVYDTTLVKKKERNEVISQYRLLTDSDVYREYITIEPYGSAELFLKEFGKDEHEYATKNCEMIRYPYMKITTVKSISILPCSALCVIENNDMNKILRDIENPQHTDWEFNRLESGPQKEKVSELYESLVTQIFSIVSEHLISSDINQTDVEGAGDYLPDLTDTSSDFVSESQTTYDGQTITHISKNNIVDRNGAIPNVDAEANVPDIGAVEDEGEEAPLPSGHNNNDGGSPHNTDNTGSLDPNGDNDILRRAQLSGVPYRFVVINKNEGKFLIIFVSPYTEENCELELYSLDDAGGKSLVDVTACKINGHNAAINQNKVCGISLMENQKYTIEVSTTQRRLFSGEVKLYAIR